MAETAYSVENHWWREGWRLTREEMGAFLTSSRRRTLSVVGVVALVVSAGGALWLAEVLELSPTWRTVMFVALNAVAVAGFAAGLALLLLARRAGNPSTTWSRFPYSAGPIFDLGSPLRGVSTTDRHAAEQIIENQRRSLPTFIVSVVLIYGSFGVGLLAAAVSGLAPAFTPFWLLIILLNVPLASGSLKSLGSTTAILQRLDEAAEPPTYLGPKAWGIEAPRNAPGEDDAPV